MPFELNFEEKTGALCDIDGEDYYTHPYDLRLPVKFSITVPLRVPAWNVREAKRVNLCGPCAHKYARFLTPYITVYTRYTCHETEERREWCEEHGHSEYTTYKVYPITVEDWERLDGATVYTIAADTIENLHLGMPNEAVERYYDPSWFSWECEQDYSPWADSCHREYSAHLASFPVDDYDATTIVCEILRERWAEIRRQQDAYLARMR